MHTGRLLDFAQYSRPVSVQIGLVLASVFVSLHLSLRVTLSDVVIYEAVYIQ